MLQANRAVIPSIQMISCVSSFTCYFAGCAVVWIYPQCITLIDVCISLVVAVEYCFPDYVLRMARKYYDGDPLAIRIYATFNCYVILSWY